MALAATGVSALAAATMVLAALVMLAMLTVLFIAAPGSPPARGSPPAPVLVFDFDGTLAVGGRLTPDARSILRWCHDEGRPYAVCTARCGPPAHWLARHRMLGDFAPNTPIYGCAYHTLPRTKGGVILDEILPTFGETRAVLYDDDPGNIVEAAARGVGTHQVADPRVGLTLTEFLESLSVV